MAETKRKGDLGMAMIMADILRRGYKVAIPIGEDCDYDLIMARKGKLERVQCKYTESDGKFVRVHCRSANNWRTKKYTQGMIEWLVTYDKTTNKCYYLPSSLLGDGRRAVNLRLVRPANSQRKGIRYAKDYLDL